MSRYADIVNDIAQWDEANGFVRLSIVNEAETKLGKDYRFTGFKSYTCNGQNHEMAIFHHLPTQLNLMLIPGGTFVMGNSPMENKVCEKNGWKGDLAENPAQEVKLRAFLLAEGPVTEWAWKVYRGDSSDSWTYGKMHPKEGISRTEARAWCRQMGMRLPREAEWEYACRASTRSVFFWGNEPDGSYAWVKENVGDPNEYVNHPITDHAKKANAFGLIDMLGSVGEWVEDDAHDYGYHDHFEGAFRSEEGETDGILRGGSYLYEWGLNRCATRIQCADYGEIGISFRPAKDLPALEGRYVVEEQAVSKSIRNTPAPPTAPPPPPKPKKIDKTKPWWNPWKKG